MAPQLTQDSTFQDSLSHHATKGGNKDQSFALSAVELSRKLRRTKRRLLLEYVGNSMSSLQEGDMMPRRRAPTESSFDSLDSAATVQN